MTDTYDKINHWYGHNGQECPVHPETKVNVATLSLNHFGLLARECDWPHIIAFRITRIYVEPKVPREFNITFDIKGNVSIEGHYQYKANETIHVREVLELTQ